MEWNGVEYIVKYARLRVELKPVEIYPVDTLEPIRPDWVAITHGVIWSEKRPGGIDGYNLYFLMDDGRCLATECFDTLEITLDQASAKRPDMRSWPMSCSPLGKNWTSTRFVLPATAAQSSRYMISQAMSFRRMVLWRREANGGFGSL
jgi:hypothetical protein